MKIATAARPETLKMNMTPMIDVCFQLIIFFMLSLRLYSPEGDFAVKMPLASPQQSLPEESETLPVRIRLRADAQGNLASIEMGQRQLASFEQLHREIRELCGPVSSAGRPEVELDCDYNLKYEYVIDALSAVSGYLADDRQTVVRMIEKLRFAPPRK